MKVPVDLSTFQNPSRAKRSIEMYRPIFSRAVQELTQQQLSEAAIQKELQKLTKKLVLTLRPLTQVFVTPEQLAWAVAFHRDKIQFHRIDSLLERVVIASSSTVQAWLRSYATNFSHDYLYRDDVDEVSHHLKVLPPDFFKRKPVGMTPDELDLWEKHGTDRMDLWLMNVLDHFAAEIDPKADLRKAFIATYEDFRFAYFENHLAHIFEAAKQAGNAAILRWRPQGKTVRRAITELRALEQAFAKEHASEFFGNKMPVAPGREVLRFKDKTAWFQIPQISCEITAKAMGHCGNEPGKRLGDQVWNFGKLVSGGYRPALTFILNRGLEGKFPAIVGEMKGRANGKPHFKFHSHILKLFESEHVGFVYGGGYLPEKNWSPDDLSISDRELWERMKKAKPELASAHAYLKAHGPEAGAWLVHHLLNFPMSTEAVRAGKIVIQEWKDLADLVAYHFDKRKFARIQYYVRLLNGQDHSEFAGTLSSDEAEKIFEAVEKYDRKNKTQLLARLKKFVLSESPDLPDELSEAVREEDWGTVGRWIASERGNVHSVFYRISARAYESGYQNEAHRAVISWIENLDIQIADLEMPEGGYWGKIQLTANLESLTRYIDRKVGREEDEFLRFDQRGLESFLDLESISDADEADWEFDESTVAEDLLEELPDEPKRNPLTKTRSLSL